MSKHAHIIFQAMISGRLQMNGHTSSSRSTRHDTSVTRYIPARVQVVRFNIRDRFAVSGFDHDICFDDAESIVGFGNGAAEQESILVCFVTHSQVMHSMMPPSNNSNMFAFNFVIMIEIFIMGILNRNHVRIMIPQVQIRSGFLKFIIQLLDDIFVFFRESGNGDDQEGGQYQTKHVW
uniref:Uncharacterized protein n=1 Tax=Cacopsylla melanoneura TaxID=428564 RepID=A0A8D8XPA9_9HEMI